MSRLIQSFECKSLFLLRVFNSDMGLEFPQIVPNSNLAPTPRGGCGAAPARGPVPLNAPGARRVSLGRKQPRPRRKRARARATGARVSERAAGRPWKVCESRAGGQANGRRQGSAPACGPGGLLRDSCEVSAGFSIPDWVGGREGVLAADPLVQHVGEWGDVCSRSGEIGALVGSRAGRASPFASEPAACASRASLRVPSRRGSLLLALPLLRIASLGSQERLWRRPRWPPTWETRGLIRDHGGPRASGSGAVGRTRGFPTPRLSWRRAKVVHGTILALRAERSGLSQHPCSVPTALPGAPIAAAAVEFPGRCVPSPKERRAGASYWQEVAEATC